MSFIDKAKQKADELKEKLTDSVKERAETVKEKTGDLAEKLGEKMPPSVKDKLDTVKDKLHREGGDTGLGDGVGETPTTGTEPITASGLVDAATDAVGDASAAGVDGITEGNGDPVTDAARAASAVDGHPDDPTAAAGPV